MTLPLTTVAVMWPNSNAVGSIQWLQMQLSPLKCNIKIYIYTHTCLFVLLLCALKLSRIHISLLISHAVSLLWHIRPCSPFSLLSC
jgi:hypothetical protein